MLKDSEVYLLVNKYIGCSGGYLGNFTYRTHHEFYPEYCDLHFDTYSMPGTTRERFIEILRACGPSEQARILRGSFKRFPLNHDGDPSRADAKQKLEAALRRLEAAAVVETPSLRDPKRVVAHALEDAEVLLRERGASSCVDRVHTALHGYARTVCHEAGLEFGSEDSLPKLFSIIHAKHPALGAVSHADELRKVLRAQAGAIDAMNTLRNSASIAHPNESLLQEPEARLVVNIANSLLQYLEGRLTLWRAT